MDELKLYDIAEIRKAIDLLFADVKFGAGECIEVRMIDPAKRGTVAGWFNDPKLLAKAIGYAARDGVASGNRFLQESVYWTCNPVSDALLSRKEKNKLDFYHSGTSDKDITRRLWLPIDLDPIRPAGISATKDELKSALQVANQVFDILADAGFTDEMSVGAMSGNGYHILIRIDLPNETESKELIARCLRSLQSLIGTTEVNVDLTVDNAARILKAYGTMARKGVNDLHRPWRMAKLNYAPQSLCVAPRALLGKLASGAAVKNLPRLTERDRRGPWTEDNLTFYLKDGTKWVYVRRDSSAGNEVCKFIGRCPNDPNHHDAAIILHTDGWWSFSCFHDSCSGFGHREFRDHWTEIVGAYDFPDAKSKNGRAKAEAGALSMTANLPVGASGSDDLGVIPLYNTTDAGNAERFTWRYCDEFLHCPQRDWYAWDGARWVPDATSAITLASIETARRIMDEFPRRDFGEGDEAEIRKRAFHKFASDSEGRARLLAMTSLAEAFLPVELNRFDADPMHFNLANGTVDLRTGELHPHRRADYITNISPATYDATADCPLWREFLNEVTGGDAELAAYLQRAVGYSLTGLTTEHAMFILWGSGRNGKSTFLEVVRHLMGTYAKAAGMNTFMAQQHEGIPNDLAALATARFVSATESDEGRRLAESKIKQLTGGDKVTARFLHKEFFEFTPQFKIWLATNHKPTIYGTDDGVWRRIRLIPFTVYIPDSKQDKKLTAKLIQEAPGILNWALSGLEQYQKHGMMEPQIVKATTSEYRSSQDWMIRFLDDSTEIDTHSRVGSLELYDEYSKWCKRTGEKQLKEAKFAEGLQTRGFKSRKTKVGEKTPRMYHGLRLRHVEEGCLSVEETSVEAELIQ